MSNQSQSDNMWDKSYRYLVEREVWIEAGKPLRDDAEIKHIFNEHCLPCEYFKKKSETLGECNICRCRLKPSGKMFNKIAWATTSCPHDPPKWIASVYIEPAVFQDQERKQKEGLKTRIVNSPSKVKPVRRQTKGCCGK